MACDRRFTGLIFLVMIIAPSVQAQAVQPQTVQNKDKAVAQNKAVKLPATQMNTIFDWKRTPQIPNLLSTGKLAANQIPNPHWRDDACLACHSKNGKQASSKNTRSANIDAICQNCHDARFDHSYIHPVDIELDAAMRKNMSKLYKQSIQKANGKVSCLTCHDITKQCLPEKKNQQPMNPRFFRGGPFRSRTEQCFHCHDGGEYQRFNPHDQIDERGKIKENTCRVCHSGSLENLKQAKSIEDVNFNGVTNLETMCWGCHRWIPHPGGQYTFFSDSKGPNHLVKPSKQRQDRLEAMSEKFDTAFPLEPGTGRVFCGTCHNPHEKGVIKNNPAAAKGADSDKRLRVKNICLICHSK